MSLNQRTPILTLDLMRRAAALCLGLVIIVGSLASGGGGPSILSDKLQHVLAYAVWTAIVAASPRGFRRIMAYAGIIALTGLLIEAVQPFVGRERSVYDLLANLAGIAVGLAGGLALRMRLYGSGFVNRRSG